jgi:hypothetical protein
MDHWDEWVAAELQAARLRQQFKQLRSEYGKAKRDFEPSKLAFFTTAERAECIARCLGDVVLDWETASGACAGSGAVTPARARRERNDYRALSEIRGRL